MRESLVRTVGAFEAKNHLSELLDLVETGQEVMITRRGKPVARLVSSASSAGEGKSSKALARVRALRSRLAAEGIKFSAEEIRSFRDEGRR
jgi:prevent-host-death family protein